MEIIIKNPDDGRCCRRFPGPDKGTRCLFMAILGSRYCAGHQGGEKFDADAYRAHAQPKAKTRTPKKARRTPRKVKP